MKRAMKFFSLCLLLISALFNAACNRTMDLNNTGRKNIALILNTNYGNYWGNLKTGAETAGREFNIDIDYSAPVNEGDIEEQVKLVNQAVEKKVDAMVIAPSDYNGLKGAVDEAYDAGIPVIVIDSEVNTDKVGSYIATDNFDAGRKAGNVLVSIVGKGGQVAIMSFVKGSRNAEQREEGFYDVISKYPDIKVVSKEYCLSDTKLAYNLTKKILSKNRRVNAIVAFNEIASEGVAQAIDEMNLKGKVKIIAFDSTLQEINYLETGVIQATIIQNPFSMGYLGVKNAVDAIDGKEIKSKIFIDSKVIDKDNMYLPENQKLLFPII